MDETNAPNTPDVNGITIQDGDTSNTITVGTGENGGSSIVSNEGSTEPTANNTTGDTEGSTGSNPSEPKDTTLMEDVAKSQNTLKAVEKDLRNKGVDFKQAIKEYEESGNISSRTLANLVNAGYPKEVIESFLEGRRAIEERFTEAVYQCAGGQEEYFKMTQWASSNLPQSTVKAFNKALDSNDIEMISLMVSGIKSKMIATRGTSNPTLLGNSQSGSQGESRGFANKDDIIKAMSDPKYGKDPEYTRSVEMKMMYTKF